MKHQEYNGRSKGRFNRATTSEEEIERMFNEKYATLESSCQSSGRLEFLQETNGTQPLIEYHGKRKGRLTKSEASV